MNCLALRTARAVLCLAGALLFTSCVLASIAQAASVPQASAGQASTGQSSARQGFGPAYDPRDEVAIAGTVKNFAQSAHGGPVGLHLLLAVSGKTVDVHLGPYFPEKNREALRPGQLVQVIGVMEKVKGHRTMLARQLIFSGRQLDIRNERGFLIRSDLAGFGKTAARGEAQ